MGEIGLDSTVVAVGEETAVLKGGEEEEVEDLQEARRKEEEGSEEVKEMENSFGGSPVMGDGVALGPSVQV